MVDVVLQMGHVARTTGATGATGEQAYSRGVVERAAMLLVDLGVQVRVIGADPPQASAYRGDVFVAVHYDASSNAQARGASVGHQTPDGQRLAGAWKHAYQRRGYDGGFRNDNYTMALAGYYGVRRAVAQGCRRAVIVEGGFGTSPTEGPWLRSVEGMTCNAWAIRDAIADTLDLDVNTFQTVNVDTMIGDDDMTPEQDALLRGLAAETAAIKAELADLRAQIGRRDDASVLGDLGRMRRDVRRALVDTGLHDGPRPDGDYEC